MRKTNKLALILNLLVIAATALAFASPLVHPGRNALPAVFGLLFPILIAVNVLFIAFWAFRKEWLILLSISILVLGWNRIATFVQLGPPQKHQAAELMVATYNVFQFHKISDATSQAQAAQEIIQSLGTPDILCLQEAMGLSRVLHELPYDHHLRLGRSSSYLLSKFPIITSNDLRFDTPSPPSGWADLLINGDTIRVFLLYLTSSHLTEETEQLMDDRRIQDGQTWKDIGKAIGKYRRAAAQRARQADQIATHILESPHPVIVCGDFNDIPQSYTTATIASGLQDSFTDCGSGIGTTYAGGIPGLRIDYILADPVFTFVSHKVPRLETSDHYPVIAGLRITDL